MTLLYIKNGADQVTVQKAIKSFINEGAKNPDVIAMAEEIVSNSTEDPVKAVYEFTKKNIVYAADPGNFVGVTAETYDGNRLMVEPQTESFIAPWKMVELINLGTAVGDCDDMAIFIAATLKALKYRARVVLLGIAGRDFDHAVAEVFMTEPQSWVIIDAANQANPMGWQIPYHIRLEIE